MAFNTYYCSYYILCVVLDKLRRVKMIDDKKYKTCKDCPYYYKEVNQCMYGEEGVPDNLEKKCDKEQ